MSDYAHTSDWQPEDVDALYALAVELGADPLDLGGCWMSESALSPRALNHGGWAAGLFQLVPDTARGLGWMHGDPRWEQIDGLRVRYEDGRKDGSLSQADLDALASHISQIQGELMTPFSQLSIKQQLEYARRFYSGAKGKLVSAAACYTKTFLPADLDYASQPLHVLCSASYRPWAYFPNRDAFDPEHKGYINVADLQRRIAKVTQGARWDEFAARVKAVTQDADTVPEPFVLREDEPGDEPSGGEAA